MNEQPDATLLIHTRRGAIIALFVGVLFALRDFRCLFELYVPGHTSWLTRYLLRPSQPSLTLDICLAVLFLGALVFAVHRSRGGERMYLAIWAGVVVLSPLRNIQSAESFHAYDWLLAILELALIPSAVWMYKSLPTYSAWSAAKLATER